MKNFVFKGQTKSKFDVTLKSEGSFTAIFFNTPKAKKWAKKNDLRNDSIVPTKNWKIDVSNSVAKKLKPVFKEDKLTVFDF